MAERWLVDCQLGPNKRALWLWYIYNNEQWEWIFWLQLEFKMVKLKDNGNKSD